MVSRTRFLVQAFEHVDGRLVPTIPNDAPSEIHALQHAEALAGRLAGAAVLKRVTTGAGLDATMILGAFGDVPDDVSDGLVGG